MMSTRALLPLSPLLTFGSVADFQGLNDQIGDGYCALGGKSTVPDAMVDPFMEPNLVP